MSREGSQNKIYHIFQYLNQNSINNLLLSFILNEVRSLAIPDCTNCDSDSPEKRIMIK